MSKFVITEVEKQRILSRYYPKKIIKEQKEFLTRLFGGSVDDIFKMYADDAVKNLDDVFAKVFKNPRNIIQKNGQNYLKSASGMEIPIENIKDLIQVAAQGKISASEIATYLPSKLADGTEFRNIIWSTLETRGAKQVVKAVQQGGSQQFFEGGLNSFKELMKKKFPMTEDEASTFIKNYFQKTGKDPRREFNKLKFGNAGGDDIFVATVLKHGIKPPVGKYLYHGTSSTNLKNIAKNGLDNSLGKTTNPGTMSQNLGSGVTTATGNIDSALNFAKSAADVTKGKDVIIRFKNVDGVDMSFFGRHKAVDPKMLEFSYDGGKTWTKTVNP